MPVKQHTLPRVVNAPAEALPEFNAVMALLKHEDLPDFTTPEFQPFMDEVEKAVQDAADANAAEIEAKVLADEKNAVRDDWALDTDVDLPGDYELSWKRPAETIKVESVRVDHAEKPEEITGPIPLLAYDEEDA
jgi:hypothetical protein